MAVRLSVDPDLVRAYGTASASHAADLQAAAATLRTLAADAAMFGPVGAAFLARLNRAAGGEADTLAGLSRSLTDGRDVAHGTAHAYQVADATLGRRLDGASG